VLPVLCLALPLAAAIARLARGGDLPRIPQSRLGAELRWHHEAWRAGLGATRYFEQDRVAEYETPSAAFTLWNAHVGYAFEAGATSAVFRIAAAASVPRPLNTRLGTTG